MKVLQNSFVGGEIAPNLYGRTDIEVYSHAAKSINNFDVCKTGGLRKRQGTQLVWHSANENAIAYREVSYFYDRTHYGAILLYLKSTDANCYYRVLSQDGTIGEECVAELLAVSTPEQLNNINIKQIGDTFFFSRRGFRCVKAFYNFDDATLTWSEVKENIDVATPPALTTWTSGFETDPDKGYRSVTRQYGLIGVRHGVRSRASVTQESIYLPWIAGATVGIDFVPEWQNHDYYILSYEYGGGWGVLKTFYPDTNWCKSSHSTKGSSGAISVAAFNGIEYQAYSTNPSTALTGNPNATRDDGNGEYHQNACILEASSGEGLSLQHPDLATTPILNLKLWFGGLMRKSGNLQEINPVGVNEPVKMTLKYKDSSNNLVELTSWSIIPSYSTSEQTFSVSDPRVINTDTCYLCFDKDVIVRDIIVGIDDRRLEFIDTNIVPGTILGEMEPVGVGDSGMDIDVVDVWEQRLVLASSRSMPFTMWFSQVGDIENFYTNRPQTTADAFSVTIPTTSASRILHTITSRWFIMFTESGEYSVDSADSGFGFDSITIKKTSAVGAHESIAPVVTESTILFVAADGRSVYELSYKLEHDAVIPINRSILASHLTEGQKIKTIAYAKFPEPRLLVLLENGTLLSMTYLPEQSVYAWSKHAFGGSLKCVDIQCPGALVEDTDLETTSLVLLTFIKADDPTRVWVERFRANSVGTTQDIGKAKCADHCGYAEEQYPNGVDPQVNVQASVTTLRPEGDQLYPMGAKRSTYETVLRLNNSGEVTLRPDIDGIEAESSKWHIDIPQVDGNEVTLLTKDAKVLPRVHTNSDGRMVIESSDGWPCEILSILYNYE